MTESNNTGKSFDIIKYKKPTVNKVIIVINL